MPGVISLIFYDKIGTDENFSADRFESGGKVLYFIAKILLDSIIIVHSLKSPGALHRFNGLVGFRAQSTEGVRLV